MTVGGEAVTGFSVASDGTHNYPMFKIGYRNSDIDYLLSSCKTKIVCGGDGDWMAFSKKKGRVCVCGHAFYDDHYKHNHKHGERYTCGKCKCDHYFVKEWLEGDALAEIKKHLDDSYVWPEEAKPESKYKVNADGSHNYPTGLLESRRIKDHWIWSSDWARNISDKKCVCGHTWGSANGHSAAWNRECKARGCKCGSFFPADVDPVTGTIPDDRGKHYPVSAWFKTPGGES